jgi:hypothetical protein
MSAALLTHLIAFNDIRSALSTDVGRDAVSLVEVVDDDEVNPLPTTRFRAGRYALPSVSFVDKAAACTVSTNDRTDEPDKRDSRCCWAGGGGGGDDTAAPETRKLCKCGHS